MKKNKSSFWLGSLLILALFLSCCNYSPNIEDEEISLSENDLNKERISELEYLSKTNLDEALRVAKELASSSENQNSPLTVAKALYWQGYVEIKNAQYSLNYGEALASARKALKLFKQSEEKVWQAKSEILIADFYYYQGQTDSAKLYIEEAKKTAKELENGALNELAALNAEIKFSEIHARNLSKDSLYQYLYESHNLYKQVNDSFGVAKTSLKLGAYYSDSGEDFLAERYFADAKGFYEKNNFVPEYAYSLLSIGRWYANRFYDSADPGHFEQAQKFLRQSIELDSKFQCFALSYLGFIHLSRYYDTDERDTLLNKKLLDSATDLYKEAIEVSTLTKNSKCLESISRYAQILCPKTNNCPEFLGLISTSYQEILVDSKNQLEKTNNSLRSFERIELQRDAENKRKQIIIYAVGIVTGFLILFLFLFQNQRIQNLRRRLEYKMEALRAQMNPHFISNSLNAIESLMNQNRKNEATHYLIQFSHLCRSILGNSRENRITLEQEIASLEYYLSLEELRMGEDLSYLITINPGIDIEKTLIPPMLIQPYVENAIWHGIQPKKSPGRVNIDIMLSENAELTCIIEDDGIGRAKSMELKSRNVELERKGGYGMTITKERLEMINKLKGANVEIVDLDKDQDGMTGTRVIITLPYTKEK